MLDGTEIEVRATTDHPTSSYGQEVWVDGNGESYGQVSLGPPWGYELAGLWADDTD